MGLKSVIGRPSVSRLAGFEKYQSVFRVSYNIPSATTLSENILTENNAFDPVINAGSAGYYLDVFGGYKLSRKVLYSATQAYSNVEVNIQMIDVSTQVGQYLDSDQRDADGFECEDFNVASISGTFGFSFRDEPRATRIRMLARNWRGGSTGASQNAFCENKCDVLMWVGVYNASIKPVINRVPSRGAVRQFK